jgi:hypothetical protein
MSVEGKIVPEMRMMKIDVYVVMHVNVVAGHNCVTAFEAVFRLTKLALRSLVDVGF